MIKVDKKMMLIKIESVMSFSKDRFKIINRIIENVKVVDRGYETPCWEWQGATSGSKEQTRGHGYGRVSIGNQMVSVHRVMYTLCHGFLPTKKQVDHKCKNRLCCNPDHLQAVTHKQNQKLRDERNV